MQCPECHREMRLLLVSYACDYCDGLQSDKSKLNSGYIVYCPTSTPGHKEYVFRTRADAERWRQIRQLEKFEVRRVVTSQDIPWQISRGSIQDLELSSRLWELYPDHRHPEGQFRAYLAPTEKDKS